MSELPPAVQNMVAQLQQLQQQLQVIINQRIQLEGLLKETEQAIAEIEKKVEDVPMYKAVGNILVKDTRENILKELKEKKETYEIRIKTLQRQEERLRERFAETQKKLQEMLKVQAG
ncbi:MAG: prefoldin subunit beta [Archaeoglobales archaeon]|nr:prefoldin subunit beta [Archaeoglobales archaeon]